MNPKLSIIVPVYNVEKYLEKCIHSILDQTFKDFELILVDDGSVDKSGIICNRYARRDNRIKVIHKKNGGQAAARNVGLNLVRGDYVGFVDSDDWIDPDMYKDLYESCIRDNADISIIGLREVNEFEIILNEYIPNDMSFSEILKRAYPCNKIFKKELFVNNNLSFVEGRFYEDQELIPKLYVKCKKVTTVNKAAYNYLKRNGSTTGSRDEKVLDNLWAYTQIKEYLMDEGLYAIYKPQFEKSVSYFKKFYMNILYDYPTIFFIKNMKRIISDFNKIGGLKVKDYLKFTLKHINFSCKKFGALCKNKLGRIHK